MLLDKEVIDGTCADTTVADKQQKRAHILSNKNFSFLGQLFVFVKTDKK